MSRNTRAIFSPALPAVLSSETHFSIPSASNRVLFQKTPKGTRESLLKEQRLPRLLSAKRFMTVYQYP